MMLMITTGPGCGDDDGGASGYVDRARSCGVLTDGVFSGADDLGATEVGRCLNDCYAAAPCEDYDYFFCGVGDISPITQACFDDCILTAFCDDGEGPIASWSNRNRSSPDMMDRFTTLPSHHQGAGITGAGSA